MNQVATIGLDIAKSIFHVHGVDAAGRSVLRQRLSRSRVLEFFGKLPRCVIGLEACASSHYWARELIRLGHEVKLMPAQYVKPYVKRGKNDAADPEAICEAVKAWGPYRITGSIGELTSRRFRRRSDGSRRPLRGLRTNARATRRAGTRAAPR